MKTNMKWLVAGIVASASIVTASAADADFYNSKLAVTRHQAPDAATTVESSMTAAEYSSKFALTAKRPGTGEPTAYAAASYNSRLALRGAAEAIALAPVK